MENSFNSRAGKRSISNSSKMNDNQNSSKEKNEPNNLNIVIEIDKNQKLPEVIKKLNIENHPEDAEALNSEKKNKKFKRRGLDLLNEELEELIQKVTNESKEESKQNKPSRRLIKRKRKSKTYKDSDESYVEEDSFDEYKYKEKDKDSIYLFRNYHNKKNENDYDIEESEDNTSDDEEIKNFLIRKTCQAKTLSRYKDLYKKKKNNRIIFLKEEDEENYFKNNENLINNESGEIEKSKKNENIADDDTEIKNRKHLKKLKKDIDNKEMGLPLDAECIICCSEIRELANPDGCNHDFCRSCLIEWSQRSAKCPICKTLYNNIFIYENGIKKQISLNEIRRNYKKENNSNESEEENIEKICYICKKNEDESNLIICERCKACFCHYYCIKLKKKPQKWYCRYCRKEIKEIRENKKKIVHFFL
jgi:hypothetical protein